MQIILVEPSHLDSWIRLRHQLWPRQSLSTHEKEALLMLSLPEKYSIFICLEKDRAVGFIEVALRESMMKIMPAKVGYIEGWYVEEKYRNKGFGKALLEEAEKWTQRQGCEEIYSDTKTTNKIGQKTHQALGFKQAGRMIIYRKKLK